MNHPTRNYPTHSHGQRAGSDLQFTRRFRLFTKRAEIGSTLRAVQPVESFREAGLGEVVIQARSDGGAMFHVLGGDGLGDLLQGFQMRSGIAISKGVIGDEIEALLQKGAESVHAVEGSEWRLSDASSSGRS